MRSKKTLLLMALCTVLAFGLAACGGSGSGGDNGGRSKFKPTFMIVSSLFPKNGLNWNDYVKGGDITNATDVACDPDADTACLHGGEMRVVYVPDESSCVGLTASDALGVFDWTCDDSTGWIRFVSTGLKNGKNLSDLIDFSTAGWKTNYVNITGGISPVSTDPAPWWSNPVVVDNDGGYLDTAGTIYVIKDDALTFTTGGYIINAPSVGLVGQPGVIINGPGVSTDVISADGSSAARDFLWIEGDIDAAGDNNGVHLVLVNFSRLDNVQANNASNDGIFLNFSSYNTLSDVTVVNNGFFGVSLYDYSSSNTLSGITANNNSDNGVSVYLSSNNNTFSHITASNNGQNGIQLYDSSGNTFTGVVAVNNIKGGVSILSSSNNTLSDVTASKNGSYGVALLFCTNNTLSDVTSSNHHAYGVWAVGSRNNTLSGVTVSNNTAGIYFDSSSSNTLFNVTASNNHYDGGYLLFSSTNTLSGLTGSNNGESGLLLAMSSNNTLFDVTASNNGTYGAYTYASSNNYFTGLLKVGNNSIYDCYIPGGPSPGLVNTTCTTDGTYGSGGLNGYGLGNISDASLYNGLDLTLSFVGKTYTDSVNADATGSAVSYPSDPATFDWLNFENHYRIWGPDGTFGDTSSRGWWPSGDGAIWDWSVSFSDAGEYNGSPALLGVLGMPTGDDYLRHRWYAPDSLSCDDIAGAIWEPGCSLPGYADQASCETASGDWTSDKCYSVFLRNAIEISGDEIGNDNLLCESGETCLYTPNIGSYQGHGNLIDAGYIGAGGTLEDITLLEYEANGR